MTSAEPSRTITELRGHLVALLERQPKSAPTVAKALRLLDQLDGQITAANAASHAAGRVRATGPRKSEVVSHYRVEPGQRGDRAAALAEHRTSEAQPFRCPWEVYLATAKELAAAPDGIGFDDLHARVNKRLGETVPIYRVRVCLRFWETAGIVEHWLKVFKPIHLVGARSGFVAESKLAWERAERESVCPTRAP